MYGSSCFLLMLLFTNRPALNTWLFVELIPAITFNDFLSCRVINKNFVEFYFSFELQRQGNWCTWFVLHCFNSFQASTFFYTGCLYIYLTSFSVIYPRDFESLETTTNGKIWTVIFGKIMLDEKIVPREILFVGQNFYVKFCPETLFQTEILCRTVLHYKIECPCPWFFFLSPPWQYFTVKSCP